MALFKSVKTDNDGVIKVSSMTDATVGARMYYTSYGAIDPTIFDLTNTVGNIVSRCFGKTAKAYTSYYDLFYDHDESNPNRQTWLNNLKDSAVWLYGSLDDGGIFLGKTSANNYKLIAINGLYRNNGNNRVQYHVAFGFDLDFTKRYEFVMNYVYNLNDQYQNYCCALARAYGIDADIRHYNAVWVEPFNSPSYAQVGWVDTLGYLKNGGFRQGLVNNINYPYSSINAITSSSVKKEFYDDAINEILTNSHTHVSGTIFSGIIHVDPNDAGGSGGQQGGGGGYDNFQDGQEPIKTNLKGCLDAGILTLYNPSEQDMQNFTSFLYSTLTDGDALALKKLFASPMDYIVCFNMCHLDLSTNIADSKTVHFGGVDSTVAMPYLEYQFIYASGGSLNVPQQCNNFLDYSPYTKAKIYIPYCGEYDLPIDLVTAGTMYLDYMIDLLSGAVTAQLSITRDRHGLFNSNMNIENAVNDLFMMSFQGNIYTQIPIGSVDNRGLVSSLLGIASATGTAIATSNPLPLMGAVANTATTSKETITKSGSISSCYGYIAPTYAQIILQRPIQNKPYEFSLYRGYPSNVLDKLGNFHEFTTVDTDTFWTDNFSKPITNEETKELKQILNDGFYLPSTRT